MTMIMGRGQYCKDCVRVFRRSGRGEKRGRNKGRITVERETRVGRGRKGRTKGSDDEEGR
jgi:hypothetical protein